MHIGIIISRRTWQRTGTESTGEGMRGHHKGENTGEEGHKYEYGMGMNMIKWTKRWTGTRIRR